MVQAARYNLLRLKSLFYFVYFDDLMKSHQI